MLVFAHPHVFVDDPLFSPTAEVSHNQKGEGLVNNLLNSNKFSELHWPSYNYLGPFTKLEERLARGDQGINPLDTAARDHDIFYSQQKDTKSRHIADKELEKVAWKRLFASDSKFLQERIPAAVTGTLMHLKRKFGMGNFVADNPSSVSSSSSLFSRITKMRKKKPSKKNLKKKKIIKKGKGNTLPFTKIVKKARDALKKRKNPGDNLEKSIAVALKTIGPSTKILKTPRVIPIPKVGGMLPLIPILAGISKIGAIAGGAHSIINAVRDIINARKQLGRSSESSSGQTIGNGMFLAPYRKGYGLFLSPRIPTPKN